MNAIGAAEWLKFHLQLLSNSDLNRINSISTDTCPTMFAMHDILRESPELRHVFFIPCDSHGLQLLCKDLLTIPRFSLTHKKAQIIVKAFKKAPLQYAHLREFQHQIYNQNYTLILSVITQWGTQYRLISSLLRSKDALRRYAEVHKVKDLGHDAFEYICDNAFWAELEILHEILKPIDEKLKMSESSKSHLGHVMNRWNDIVDHLHRKAMAIPELIDFLEQSDDDITGTKGAFHRRYNRQVTTIHTVAYFLMPENRQVQIPVVYERPIYNFFRQYTNSQTEYETICEEFQAFRSQQAPFESIHVCWDHIQKPKVFWSHQGSYTSMIGTLAKHIFSTPVNSVASERAFSIQNLIHMKL